MNSISILGYIISDLQILNGSLTLANSMICDELSADEATFTINYTGSMPYEDFLYASGGEQLFSEEGEALMAWFEQSATIDLNDIPYGTPLVYSHDGVVIGKFYTTSVIQISPKQWQIKAQSAMGLLVKQEHNGGIYSISAGDTIKSVIDEIMAGLNIPYTVSDAIKSQGVTNWLPIASCRDNLQQLCFAFGVSVMKDSNGDLLFDFNEPDTPEAELPLAKTYIGGTKTLLSPATKVTVYEHAYYPITTRQSKVVFDNTGDTAAVNQKVVFDNPVILSTLTYPNTITIDPTDQNENYIIVSGTGQITAVEYTHTIKVLEKYTGVSTTENKELTVKDATLVNALNSTNCLNRVAAYYSQASEINYAFVAENERPGELVTYTDPFTSAQKAGLIKTMNITVSGKLKSQSKLTENWMPDYLGNNFSSYELLTSGASWTATKTGTVRIALCGGGQGGHAGYQGAQGTGYLNGESKQTYGGQGGLGGKGGNGGKLFVFDVSVTQGTTYNISIGTGGLGGNDGNGGLGTYGTDSTITIGGTTYSSANGASPEFGYVNALSGDIYAVQGNQGTAGADGGDGGGWPDGYPGGNITYNGVTYYGGSGGPHGSAGDGGSGGGAAVGANGGNGYDGGDNIHSGLGGVGASATIAGSGNSGLGGGGNGGHGGGGGGAFGMYHYWGSYGGVGGNGSAGAQGGNGFILILE